MLGFGVRNAVGWLWYFFLTSAVVYAGASWPLDSARSNPKIKEPLSRLLEAPYAGYFFVIAVMIWAGFFLHFGWDMYSWEIRTISCFLLRYFKRPC